jgi:hypothetical protein
MVHDDIDGLRRGLAHGSPDLIAPDLASQPLNLLVLGDFGGEDLDAPLAERLSAAVEDVDASLAALSPIVRVRVEEVDSADDALIDVKLTFRNLADFSRAALEAAIPALTRSKRPPASPAVGSPQTDLERAIAAALSGGSAPSASAMSDRGPSRDDRQLGLVRAVPRLASVERAWLGLARIIEAARAVPSRRVAVRLLPISPRELGRELARVDAGDDSELADVLDGLSSRPETRPDLMVVDEAIGFGPDGAAALRALARLSTDCAAIALATARDAELSLDGDRPLDGAAAAERVVSDLGFAGFRSLRSDARAAGLAIAAGAAERPRAAERPCAAERSCAAERPRPLAAADPWRQSPALAVCEALIGTATALRAGERLTLTGRADAAKARGAATAAAAAAFAARGLIVPWVDDRGLCVGPDVPVVFDPPRLVRDKDETARAAGLDLRTRLALAWLTRLASIAVRAQGAPGRDREACAAFATALGAALRPAVERMVGGDARILLSASFDGPDERSLRLELALSVPRARAEPSGGVHGRAPLPEAASEVLSEGLAEVRCGCYPLV